MMVWLDARVLRAYTRVAHALQRLTGRSCYFYAQQCGVLEAILSTRFRFIDAADVWPLWLVGSLVVIWLCLAWRTAQMDRQWRKAPDALPYLASPTPMDPYFRVVMLSFAVPDVLLLWALVVGRRADLEPVRVLSGCVSTFAYVSYWYLRGVTPMPPAAKRDRVRGTLIPHGSEA